MDDYLTIDCIERRDQVAFIEMAPRSIGLSRGGNAAAELGEVFTALRGDNSIRVIVLTGSQQGEFLIAYPTETKREFLGDPATAWASALGTIRCHQAMAEIEKPIIARVNGDAIGLGQSLMLACDIIVARRDAKISDVHLGMGEVVPSSGEGPVGPPFGLAPGDGGGSLISLFMTPTQAKEYMMLSTEFTAEDLARVGVVNHAVPADDLDSKVDDIVEKLLSRSAYALAWTKRILSRRVVDYLNLTLDAAVAYELVNLAQADKLGANDRVLG